MNRHQLLRGLHQVLKPRTYLEIGVREGKSLALSRCRTVAIDPFFTIDREILCDLHLVRTSSDELFARPHPLAHFEEAWAGDVFKIIPALLEHRPDLTVLQLDTTPTGTLVLMNLDARSAVLRRAYDQLVERFVTPDPQVVPDDIRLRRQAIDPRRLVGAPFWGSLVEARDQGGLSVSTVRDHLAGAGLQV